MNCDGCNSLETISFLSNLKYLNCDGCNSLETIPCLPNLKYLGCYNCRLLTKIEIMPILEFINCHNCPWLKYEHLEYRNEALDQYFVFGVSIENKKCIKAHEKNLANLIQIQRWYKKYKKIKKFIGLLTSENFLSWYYYPVNQGGKQTILRLHKTKT